MSHGGQHPTSGSSYIIICNGRIAVGLAHSPEEKVLAASRCAADACAYLGSRYRSTFDHADLAGVTSIQHPLMDKVINGENLEKAETEERCGALLDALTVLELKYDSGGTY